MSVSHLSTWRSRVDYCLSSPSWVIMHVWYIVSVCILTVNTSVQIASGYKRSWNGCERADTRQWEEREPCNKISLRMQRVRFSIRHSPRVSHKCILLSWEDEQCICTGSFKSNVGKRVLSKPWTVWHFLKTGERLSCLLFKLLFIGYLFADRVYWRWCWKHHWQDFGWLHSTGQDYIKLRLFLQ